MRDLKDLLQESAEFNPSFSSHKKVWNDLVKWYDKAIRYMTSDEVADLLQTAIQDIKDASFDEIR